jgi:hypothetical protein
MFLSGIWAIALSEVTCRSLSSPADAAKAKQNRKIAALRSYEYSHVFQVEKCPVFNAGEFNSAVHRG